MGFFSGLCSFIGSCVSAVGSAIGSIASGIGRALSISPLFTAACAVIKAIAEAISVKDKDEDFEEIGCKMEKSGKKLEDFKTFDEYKQYIDSIKLTPEDRLKIETDKDKYLAFGMAFSLKGMESKFSLNSPLTYDSVETLLKTGLDAKGISTVLKDFGEKKVNVDFDKMEKMELSEEKFDKVYSTFKESINTLDNKEEILNKLDKLIS